MKLETVLRCCFSDGIPQRSVAVALIVGSILNLVNQGDRLLRAEHVDLLKILLTYSVPYLVLSDQKVTANRAVSGRNSVSIAMPNQTQAGAPNALVKSVRDRQFCHQGSEQEHRLP